MQFGGADRDRTDDPLLAKQVLSQLSYSPNLAAGQQRSAFSVTSRCNREQAVWLLLLYGGPG